MKFFFAPWFLFFLRLLRLFAAIFSNAPTLRPSLMTTSIFYQTPWLYEGLMRVLYRGGYNARSEALAALIPERSSVVDLCCGPATLYFKYLRFKQVSYTGLDINRGFVERLSFLGSEKVRNPLPDGTTVTGMVWDATADAPLPKGSPERLLAAKVR